MDQDLSPLPDPVLGLVTHSFLVIDEGMRDELLTHSFPTNGKGTLDDLLTHSFLKNGKELCDEIDAFLSHERRRNTCTRRPRDHFSSRTVKG